MRTSRKTWITGSAWLGLFIFSSIAGAIDEPTENEAAAAAAVFELAPGVIVDPDRQVVYLMRPEGGMEAVLIDDGDLLWANESADKPLGVHGNLLVAQADPKGPGDSTGVLPMFLLDRVTGEARLDLPLRLPGEVPTRLDSGPGGALEVAVQVREGELLVGWRQDQVDLRAIPGGPEPREALREFDGAFRIDLGSERAMPVSPQRLAPRTPTVRSTADGIRPAQSPHLSLDDGPVIVEIESGDGRHLLISQRVAPGVSEEYRWTILESATGELAGRVRARTSFAPFFVREKTIIFEEDSTGDFVDGRLTFGPRQLRCVALGDGASTAGAVLWEHPLRDTTYRGPLPH
ncbi:MAG: hypothetical protein GY719_16320 [bacterium]|nr:hypothetical protein [bacterium]